MRKFCEVCGKEVETRVVTRMETYEVYDEAIDINAQVLVCSECGEDLFCEELDTATLTAAFNEYRRIHKLLSPSEIKAIREKYDLSQRSFSKLLNWGDKTINRYENGSIQDKAHNSLLLFLREPHNMRTYITENEVALDAKQLSRLLETVNRLEADADYRSGRRFFNLFFSNSPSVENGFHAFDYDKFCAMVLYFANKGCELLKTKLLKLLNYSDMVFYKENGISISGTRYVHLPYGPVPENFDILFGAMNADNIAHIEVIYENGYEKHQVIADRSVPPNVLSPAETDVLERVFVRFAAFGSREISAYSHKEKGYASTEQGDIIPYTYAKDITLSD